MPAQSIELQPRLSLALSALFAADDAMPEGEHADTVRSSDGTLVVLLGSRHAWAAWLLELKHIAVDVHAQASLHVATAEAVVCGCRVMLVCGDCPPDVPPCTCEGPVRHAVTDEDKRRVEGLQAAAGVTLAAYYSQVLARCETSVRASALGVAA